MRIPSLALLLTLLAAVMDGTAGSDVTQSSYTFAGDDWAGNLNQKSGNLAVIVGGENSLSQIIDPLHEALRPMTEKVSSHVAFILGPNNTWHQSNALNAFNSSVIILGGNNTGSQSNLFTADESGFVKQSQQNQVVIVGERNFFSQSNRAAAFGSAFQRQANFAEIVGTNNSIIQINDAVGGELKGPDLLSGNKSSPNGANIAKEEALMSSVQSKLSLAMYKLNLGPRPNPLRLPAKRLYEISSEPLPPATVLKNIGEEGQKLGGNDPKAKEEAASVLEKAFASILNPIRPG